MIAKTREGRQVDLTQDVLDGLRMRLRGPLFSPGDSGYAESRTVWNVMIDRRPAVVARCLGVGDVIACVQFARAHDLLLCIKGGGHNIAGLASAESLGQARRTRGWRFPLVEAAAYGRRSLLAEAT